jgi:hypothetical protein
VTRRNGFLRNVHGLWVECQLAGTSTNEPFEPAESIAEVALDDEGVVSCCLSARQQDIECRDVKADAVCAKGGSFDQCCAAASEGIEHSLGGLEVTLQEDLHELGYELPKVRMKPVNVLRAEAFGQFGFGPGELRVKLCSFQALVEFALSWHLRPSLVAGPFRLVRLVPVSGGLHVRRRWVR